MSPTMVHIIITMINIMAVTMKTMTITMVTETMTMVTLTISIRMKMILMTFLCDRHLWILSGQ